MDIVLKQELNLSTKTLRCADRSGYFLLVGSFNKQVFLLVETDGTYQLIKTFDLFESEVYSIRFITSSTFAVGCKNGTIYIMDLEGELIHVLSQSSATVSSLDSSLNYLSSGHWDGTCILWSLETFEKIKILEDHKFAVVCKFLPNGNLVTGSQTGELNLWKAGTFERINQVQAHTDIIRCIDVVGHHIITCSNDELIKLWSSSLSQISEQKLHKSFVYAVAHYREVGEGLAIISGGEDFKLVISINLKEAASIPFPTTIWVIIANEKANEFIVFGDDGILRVFTTDKNSITNFDLHNAFISCAELASLKNPEISAEDMAKFPLKESMATMIGKKEGEVKVFNNKGKGEAFVWQNGKWEYLGEMIGANATMGQRFYEGDKHFPQGNYDFIFDVQDDTGLPRLLPFNKGDNPLEATEKFIAREQISIAFKEQILNFVIKNSKGTANNKNAQSKPAEIKPQSLLPKLKHFPIVDFVFYASLNSEALKKRVHELNDLYEGDQYKQKKMNKTELMYFDSLLGKLNSSNNMQGSTLADMEVVLVEGKLLKWVEENDIAILDLMRVFVLHPDASKILNSVDSGLKVAIFTVTFAKFEQEKYFILILKLISNLFKNNSQTFFKSDNIFREFLTIKASKFSTKVTSAFISMFGNLIFYLIENQKYYDYGYLLEFLAGLDLGFILSSEQESINFLLLIGNTLASGNEDLIRIIKNSYLKTVIDQIVFDSHGFLLDVKEFLAKV
jgi:phospholipase A-2-activating protein